MSEAPARRSPISTSAPWSGVRPEIVAWRLSIIRDSAPIRFSSESHSRRSSKIVSWTCDVPLAWVSRTEIGGWMSVARPGYGAVSMSDGPEARLHEARAVDDDRVARARQVDARAPDDLDEAPEMVARRALDCHLAARDRRGDDERAGLDPVGMTRCSAPRRRRLPSTSIVSG